MRHALTFVLGVFVATATGCGRATSADEHVSTPAAPTASPKKPWDYAAEMKKLLPGNDKIVGWKLEGEPTVVDAAKLAASGWERMSQFQPYGLRDRMSASFVPTSPGKPPFKLDVYFLESPIAAFGLFATTRTTESNFVKVGNQGIEENGGIRFWKGPLYAEIQTTGDIAPPRNFLDTVAKDVAARMVMQSRVPDLLGLLPGRGLVANSQKYVAFDGFGPKAPRLSVVADYKLDGVDFRLATAQAATPAEATAALQAVRATVESGGQLRPVTTACGEEIFASAALADRVTFYVRQGPFLALVENVPGESFAADLLKDLGSQMSHALDQKELDDAERNPQQSAGTDVKGH
jgi:uncharacterized protein DUF6599